MASASLRVVVFIIQANHSAVTSHGESAPAANKDTVEQVFLRGEAWDRERASRALMTSAA